MDPGTPESCKRSGPGHPVGVKFIANVVVRKRFSIDFLTFIWHSSLTEVWCSKESVGRVWLVYLSPPQMPTFPLANRWDSKSWFWGWIANEFSMPNDQRNARQKLPEVRVVLMYVHAREETVYRRAIERGVQGRVVSKVEVHPDSLWMACGDTLVSQNDPKWHKPYFNHPIWDGQT